MATIKRKMQQYFKKILKWIMINGFKISCNKTKLMHFYQIHKMHNQPILTLNGSEISITQQCKLLGITLDPKLSFIPPPPYQTQPNYPTPENHSPHRLECSPKTLTKLYRCLIWPKLDYGCFIYGATRKSYLQDLETIHHQRLLIALGDFTTSPIESLYIEVNEPSLSLRRYKLVL